MAKCYTFYKGVFTQEQLSDYLVANGDLPECEMFKKRETGDDDKIKNAGIIIEENCDDELFNEIPDTLKDALNY